MSLIRMSLYGCCVIVVYFVWIICRKELTMPRKPRCYLPNVPCHVITRGNDRQACFFESCDYQFYLEVLSDACERYKVALHAYM